MLVCSRNCSQCQGLQIRDSTYQLDQNHKLPGTLFFLFVLSQNSSMPSLCNGCLITSILSKFSRSHHTKCPARNPPTRLKTNPSPNHTPDLTCKPLSTLLRLILSCPKCPNNSLARPWAIPSIRPILTTRRVSLRTKLSSTFFPKILWRSLVFSKLPNTQATRHRLACPEFILGWIKDLLRQYTRT